MRSISEIYNRLAMSKNSMSELQDYVINSTNPPSALDNAELLLADIQSASKVALWRLWLWIMAVGSWIVEGLFDVHKDEITAILAAKRPHTLRWYAEESKKFQYGHALVWENNQYSYEQIDPAAQIIKYAAASEQNSLVILKVAKEVSGVKVPLSNLEKTTFSEFWAQWKDAGTKLEIRSFAADILKINLTIVRDRLVLAADNSLLTDSSVFPIDDAISNYGGSLEFDGKIILSKLVDKIQAAKGIIDVKLTSAYHKPDGGSYTSVNMSAESVSGYFIIAADSVFDYIDNVTVTVLE